MRDLKGKVAVITGAASGIGRAFADRCMAEGMRLALADVDPAGLTAVEVEARERGVPVVGVLTDVAIAGDVEVLAARTISKFGAVHLLFNNAGVSMVGPRTWESTKADWEWIVGVNLWGLVHGVRIFVPIMIDQATECHIVNTASAAGLLPLPGMGIYGATKAAAIMLSETLQRELEIERASIKVSVVCPGPVKTRLVDAARNRPVALQNNSWVEVDRRAKYGQQDREMRDAMDAGMSPEEVAEAVFEAIRKEELYVFTHSWVREEWQGRLRKALRSVPRRPSDQESPVPR